MLSLKQGITLNNIVVICTYQHDLNKKQTNNRRSNNEQWRLTMHGPAHKY